MITTILVMLVPAAFYFGRKQGFGEAHWWWTRQADGPPIEHLGRVYYVIGPSRETAAQKVTRLTTIARRAP